MLRTFIVPALALSLVACTASDVTLTRDVAQGASPPAAPPAQGAAPTVSLTANPTSVASGGASTLTWSSTNADACVSSGAWGVSNKSMSGSQSTGGLTTSSNFSLTCTGSGGSATASAAVTVAGVPPPPAVTVSLAADPTSVPSGGSSTLTWSSTNADSCAASGAWVVAGVKSTSGKEPTGTLTTTSTFSLSCTGSGGTDSASATVLVLPPPLANLPAWVNALAIGQWYQIPNTAMSSVEPSPQPAGATGPASKVIAWTSFVVDTRTSKVYSVANGGHNDYAGNEVDELALENEAPFWTEVLAPSSSVQNASYYADGRPSARHTYYGVTLDEFNDRVMLFGGSPYQDGGFMREVSSYNIGSNSYNGAGTHPNLPTAFLVVPAVALDPSTGNVYLTANSQIGRWNRSSNTLTANLNATGTGPVGSDTMAALDTSRGRILLLGGGGSDHHLYTLSSNAFSTITVTGANAVNVVNLIKGALVYVPALDKFLARSSAAGGTIYQIDPSTFEATTFVTAGGASVPSTTNGPYNKFLYVPRLRGAVYVPSYNGSAWFLRLH